MSRPSLTRQIQLRLVEMTVPGSKKHEHKQQNGGKPYPHIIYGYTTLKGYMADANTFAHWAKEKYNCRQLDELEQYATEWLVMRCATVAPSTVHRNASALAKLFGRDVASFGVELPRRERGDFVKNRGYKWVDHYDPEQHTALETISKGTGARRHEIQRITPEQVIRLKNGRVIVRNLRGKGGKVRSIRVRDEYADAVMALAEKAMEEGRPRLISEKIPDSAPLHAYRGKEYAQKLYAQYARPVEQLPREEQYRCRKDMKGVVLDRRALEIVTKELGHSRLGVVINYFRPELDEEK